MSKPVPEKLKVRFNTTDGNRMDFEGTGDVVMTMAEVFKWIGPVRRTRMLKMLQAIHEERLAREASNEKPE